MNLPAMFRLLLNLLGDITMQELSMNELQDVNGGGLGRFLAQTVISGAIWDGMKAAASSLVGASHNATNPHAATNKL